MIRVMVDGELAFQGPARHGIYIEVAQRGEPLKTYHLAPGILVDRYEDGNLAGVEVLNARGRVRKTIFGGDNEATTS